MDEGLSEGESEGWVRVQTLSRVMRGENPSKREGHTREGDTVVGGGGGEWRVVHVAVFVIMSVGLTSAVLVTRSICQAFIHHACFTIAS